MASFLIRNLRHEDISALVKLPQGEGREMGLDPEIHTWLKVDPDGIFIAEDVKDGQIAGCCSGIALSDTHGYIGMYVVDQKHRGLGLGKILWEAAISRLGDRNISLSSVDKMLQYYKTKAGFGVSADWTVDLYTTTHPILPADLMPISPGQSVCTIVVDPESPFVENVVNYDNSIHQYDRSAIVRATLSEPGTVTVMAVEQNVFGSNLVVSGYACMKKSMQNHWLIAPIYADDFNSAYSLMYGLVAGLSAEQRQDGIVAKLVSSNCEAAKLFRHFGLKRSKYQLRRLFTKEVFHIPEKKIFALQTSVFCTE